MAPILAVSLVLFKRRTRSGNRHSAAKNSDPNGTRTRVAGVKGRSPRPLDDGAVWWRQIALLQNDRIITAVRSRQVGMLP